MTGFEWSPTRVCPDTSAVCVFLNDFDAGIDSFLSKFAGDAKLGSIVKMLEDGSAVQKDLSRLGSWVGANRIAFNIDKMRGATSQEE